MFFGCFDVSFVFLDCLQYFSFLTTFVIVIRMFVSIAIAIQSSIVVIFVIFVIIIVIIVKTQFILKQIFRQFDSVIIIVIIIIITALQVPLFPFVFVFSPSLALVLSLVLLLLTNPSQTPRVLLAFFPPPLSSSPPFALPPPPPFSSLAPVLGSLSLLFPSFQAIAASS